MSPPRSRSRAVLYQSLFSTAILLKRTAFILYARALGR